MRVRAFQALTLEWEPERGALSARGPRRGQGPCRRCRCSKAATGGPLTTNDDLNIGVVRRANAGRARVLDRVADPQLQVMVARALVDPSGAEPGASRCCPACRCTPRHRFHRHYGLPIVSLLASHPFTRCPSSPVQGQACRALVHRSVVPNCGLWHHSLMSHQPRTPGCGCALAFVVVGSFLINIYGGDIYFPAVLFIASIMLVCYIIYWTVRQR